MTDSPDPKVLELLREKIPEVTKREAMLFEHLWRLIPHVPPNLTNLTSGRPTLDHINEWLEETYGFRFSLRKPEPKPKAKRGKAVA